MTLAQFIEWIQQQAKEKGLDLNTTKLWYIDCGDEPAGFQYEEGLGVEIF